MSNKLIDTLDAIKKIVFSDVPAAPAGQFAGTEYPCADGTVLMIDKLEVGGIAMIGDQPAPAGEYTLQDGTKVTVADGGTIAEVASAAEEVSDPAGEDMSKKFAEQFTALSEKVNSYETKFGEMAGVIEGFKTELAQAKEGIKQLIEVVEKLAEIPKEEPAANPVNKFSKQEEKENRLKSLAVTLHKIKNN